MANPQPDKHFIMISTELFEAIMKTRIPSVARMVFDYIIRMTYGYKLKEFETTHYKIANDLKLKQQRVNEGLIWLVKHNIINNTVQRVGLSRNNKTILGIQKDYERWINNTEKRVDTEKRVVNNTEIRKTSSRKKKENKCANAETTRKSVLLEKTPPNPPRGDGVGKETKKFNPPSGSKLKSNGEPWIDSEAWDDFVQHRREIKKPLTDLAVKKSIEFLSQFKDRQREIIDTSIRCRWQGLFPPKKQFNTDDVDGPRLPILEPAPYDH
jgi:hypothetical protein